MPVTSITALIVAAGSGQRFGHELPKQFHLLDGQPVLRHAVAAFCSHPRIDRVMVVYPHAWAQAAALALQNLRNVTSVPGGDTRQQSVRIGLEALAEQTPPAQILIHDGARPLVHPGLIDRVLSGLQTAPAVTPGLAVTDTLKQTHTDAQQTRIVKTVNRQDFARIQTPQGFDFATILAAHQKFADQMFTDDAALIEAYGGTVIVVPGDEDNLKITRADDLIRAHQIRQHHMPAAQPPCPDIRVGSGFDVHRLIPGDGVILCGHKIPCSWRLEGHSDADVALHALCDALFGALGDGDIGQHFPPSDPQWRGADSAVFLAYALECVRTRGGCLNHIDITIMCEQPKIGPQRALMLARLAALTGLPPQKIGLKATTTERLGFTGRGEGIAAQATATILFPYPTG